MLSSSGLSYSSINTTARWPLRWWAWRIRSLRLPAVSCSGLAPILSLTEAALRRGYKQPVTLMFSAREAADLYDVGLMRYWQVRYPNFRYLPTLTRDAQEGVLQGRIPAILGQHFPDLSGHSVFVAGTTGFVDDCVAAAKALGATPELIHTEGFFAQA